MMLLVAVLLSLGISGIAPANDAAAGSNGQQIKVTNCSTCWLTFSGRNQNGDWTTVSRAVPGWTSDYSLSAYWWVGDVSIHMTAYNLDKTITVNVPKSQRWSDWVTVSR